MIDTLFNTYDIYILDKFFSINLNLFYNIINIFCMQYFHHVDYL